MWPLYRRPTLTDDLTIHKVRAGENASSSKADALGSRRLCGAEVLVHGVKLTLYLPGSKSIMLVAVLPRVPATLG
ncbi:hypothetical protein PsorP6_009495 [Peronosclerospora sorghi]|uniref:Uncharacterized protein n=1 Tax=Peronosclerospora sorghi TaxID=230839 RepID=A0ACC0VZG6_9STRA|nr:hypothetical protein PsorP6_009495 [Peronosclerospora sorghi]